MNKYAQFYLNEYNAALNKLGFMPTTMPPRPLNFTPSSNTKEDMLAFTNKALGLKNYQEGRPYNPSQEYYDQSGYLEKFRNWSMSPTQWFAGAQKAWNSKTHPNAKDPNAITLGRIASTGAAGIGDLEYTATRSLPHYLTKDIVKSVLNDMPQTAMHIQNQSHPALKKSLSDLGNIGKDEGGYDKIRLSELGRRAGNAALETGSLVGNSAILAGQGLLTASGILAPLSGGKNMVTGVLSKFMPTVKATSIAAPSLSIPQTMAIRGGALASSHINKTNIDAAGNAVKSLPSKAQGKLNSYIVDKATSPYTDNFPIPRIGNVRNE